MYSFGSRGCRHPGCCDVISVPAHLQPADVTVVLQLVLSAKNGKFHDVRKDDMNNCLPLPFSLRGNTCKNNFHRESFTAFMHFLLFQFRVTLCLL